MTGAAKSAPSVRDVVDFPMRPARWERFAELHFRAFQKYVPKPYAGRVSLISASTQPLTWLNDAERAWRHLTPEVDVYRAPGTHFSIVEEPNVRVLAEAIEEAMRRAGARGR